MAYSTFVHFKSTDSGAPALATTNGSGITWLDWILVTKGGWSKPFSGTNKAVYQMPGGNGRVIRAVHDSAISGSTGKMTVRGANSASAVDTLSQPFPLVATVADANSTWPIVASAAYEGIVTESFVSIMMARAANTWTLWQFFGDAVPVAAGDTNNTIIRVMNNAANTGGLACQNSPPSSVTLGATSPLCFAYATYDGATLAPVLNCFNPGVQNFLGYCLNYPNPEKISNRVPFNEISLGDLYTNSTGTWDATNGAARRLVIPNMWQGLTSGFPTGFTQLDTLSDAPVTGASLTMFSGQSDMTNAASGMVYMQTTNDWALLV
jgi:hypothetical protein